MSKGRNKNGMSTITVVADILTEACIPFERDNVMGFETHDEPFDTDPPKALTQLWLPNKRDALRVFQFDGKGFYLGVKKKSEAFILSSECA